MIWRARAANGLLARYPGDLFHEDARPGHPEVTTLA